MKQVTSRLHSSNNDDNNDKDDSSKKDSTTTCTGFWIVPDTQGWPGVYHALPTLTIAEYNQDALSQEQALSAHLFSNNDTSPLPKFKLSCALCMLRHQPNGFCCIAAATAIVVQRAVDWALAAKKRQQQQQHAGVPLHADHADYVCVVSIEALQKATQKRKPATRSNPNPDKQRSDDTLLLRQALQDQGVPLAAETTRTIHFGHHVTAMLQILQHNKKHLATLQHVLVIIYHDHDDNNNDAMQIDLPGGKRHLGESAWECATRETAEETSLSINDNWRQPAAAAAAAQPPYYFAPRDEGNAVFFVQPPPVGDGEAERKAKQDDVQEARLVQGLQQLKVSKDESSTS